MGNKFKTLVKDTLIFAIGNVGSKLILFFLVPLYTAYLTQEQYGTADLIFTIAQLVLPVVSIVIHDAVIRFGLSKNERKEDVLLVSYIVLGIGSCITLLLTPLFGLYSAIGVWKLQLSIYILLSAFNNVNMNYLKVKDKNYWYAIISLIHTALMALLNIVLLAQYHLGIEGYLFANIGSMGVGVLLSLIIGEIPKDLRKARFRNPLFSEMIKYSFPLILNNISWWVVHSSDKVMVEAMLGASALGLYTVAAKIPALINVMINIFSQAWGIASVKEFETTNDTVFYSKVLEAYSFICFGASIALIAVIKPFMKIYVSNSFYESWRYVPILLVAAAFASIAYFYGSLYGALKKSGRNMITTLVAAFTNIIVNYIGIKLMGTYGAAIGTLVAYIVMSLARMIDVARFIPIKINRIKLLIVCSLVILQAIFVTVDYKGLFVSVITIIVYVLINYRMIRRMTVRINSTFRR